MTTHDAAVVVVGAGAVGLAVAQRLARRTSVMVVEAHEGPGRETSGHNSGVVHASIYYETGSLKHLLCWEGNPLLYEWAEAHHVPVRRTGKIIAAFTEAERGGLDEVWRQASANGARGIERLTRERLRALEPVVPAIEGIWSPSTGVVDPAALVRSYERAARDLGATIVYRHRVIAAERTVSGFRLTVEDADGTRSVVQAAALVNAAGHAADRIAASLGYPLDGGTAPDASGVVPAMRQRANRGRYYDIVDPAVARLVSRPVYPLPEHAAGGLGLHLTVDVDGGVHLGPNAEWIADNEPLDYRHAEAPEQRALFLAAGRRYLPGLRDDQIAPGQIGYRPKIQRPDEGLVDFLVWHDRGYIHLGGIESPGLTSSLPLAARVDDALR